MEPVKQCSNPIWYVKDLNISLNAYHNSVLFLEFFAFDFTKHDILMVYGSFNFYTQVTHMNASYTVGVSYSDFMLCTVNICALFQYLWFTGVCSFCGIPFPLQITFEIQLNLPALK